MKKRETETSVVWEGREFKVKKMDAMTACYTAQFLMTKGMGIVGPLLASKVGNMPALPKGLPSMSKAEFRELQRDLLYVCEEKLGAGYTCVLDDKGVAAVSDFDDNVQLVLTLTAKSLVWNLSDFFDERLLKALKENLADISLFKPKTSELTSSDQ